VLGEGDITPIEEIATGIWLYSDGKYRDVWGLPEEGMSAEEAREMAEGTGQRYAAIDEQQAQANLDKTLLEIQQMLDSANQSGQMTEYDSRYMDYLLQQAAESARQFNLGNELDWKKYEQAQQQLQLQRDEWLAELKANPATWPERWAAEHLPVTAPRQPLASDATIAQYNSPTNTQWSPTNTQWELPRTPIVKPSQDITKSLGKPGAQGLPRTMAMR